MGSGKGCLLKMAKCFLRYIENTSLWIVAELDGCITTYNRIIKRANPFKLKI